MKRIFAALLIAAVCAFAAKAGEGGVCNDDLGSRVPNPPAQHQPGRDVRIQLRQIRTG